MNTPNIQFFDSHLAPKPKDQVKIESVKIAPYPDRFRVLIQINITPFQKRPNLLIIARDNDDRIVSELNVIESMHSQMEFTIHIRNVEDPAGAYSLTVDLFYENKNPPQDTMIEGFVIPEADES